mmetsp:Transcript_2359/g.4464  ORF Transcript_2359/g.4464 Transcript_2359/m.4464 type:complete len:317 (-) Transcript_2359:401-1351(-)|eukprot:CAMPEP_0170181424 /NCGR_PEP_ID=MMETSP0040_2-20121228/25096_1 /TAXON_ID=641309 /ORGANISM="Lotharella oceanica, Strain CCMP622" /LENGTH=316 /DNA_ID=CAMNT_0010426471 /DNA_START=11 /DNA_END=961 /DNA_ORIENTATION=-
MDRLQRIAGHLANGSLAVNQSTSADSYRTALKQAKADIWKMLDTINCNPILVRLAWHDAGTYDMKVKDWPNCGGANGSIRFDLELGHGANAGLLKAINYLKKIKAKYPISWADLIQLGSATAIEHAGGPVIPMKYGRIDTETKEECPKEGNLPDAYPPFGDGASDAARHLRNVFYRMGFNDREIVALSGAHTIGRAFKERSGVVDNGYGEDAATKFTCPFHRARADKKEGVGMAGGKSWTSNWLTFDNSYFKRDKNTKDLLWMPTDDALRSDPSFQVFFEMYAKDKNLFFEDYKKAHKKLSELGSKFGSKEGISIN